MGRPDADPSAYESQQTQTEYELQPQEYEQNHEATPTIPDECLAATYQNNQQDQPQQMGTPGNDPQAQQQQFQPQQFQQQFQPPPAQQQPPQYPPPQPNQAYPPPQRPAPYPPQNVQNNPVYPNRPNQQPAAYPPQNLQNNPVYPNRPNQQPGAYPPQNLQNNPVYPNGPNQQPAVYPPQAQPVQYPPQSPPTIQMYSNVSPPVMQSQTVYAPNVSPQAFPQPAYLPPASPHKPGGQPPAAVAGIPVGPGAGEGWRSGLFDFMDDPMNALVTAFFPCLTFGQIAEIVDDGHTTCGTSGLLYGAIGFLIGIPCLMSCTYRTKLRNKFGLPEAPAPDWVTHFLCEWCALCQEYRELQLRGWDPSIGWQGNLARNQMQQPVMMAPMNQRMMA